MPSTAIPSLCFRAAEKFPYFLLKWTKWICTTSCLHTNNAIKVQKRGTTARYTVKLQKRGTTARYTVKVQNRGTTARYTLKVQKRGTTARYTLKVQKERHYSPVHIIDKVEFNTVDFVESRRSWPCRFDPVHASDKVDRIGNSRLCCRFVAGFGNSQLCHQCVELC